MRTNILSNKINNKKKIGTLSPGGISMRLDGAATTWPLFAIFQKNVIVVVSDGDFGKYFHLPVSVNFGKWILFTGKLPVNKKNQLTP
jgi:hypothetical protein